MSYHLHETLIPICMCLMLEQLCYDVTVYMCCTAQMGFKTVYKINLSQRQIPNISSHKKWNKNVTNIFKTATVGTQRIINSAWLFK